jgi:hypothetical protein
MGIGDSIQNGIGILEDNALVSIGAAAVGGAVVGGIATGLIVSAVKKKRVSKNRVSRKRSHRIKHTSRGWAQDRKRRSKQKWEVAYQRRKKHSKRSKSRKGIHYTKKGQPYKIMSNGRSRFIKKSKGGKK